MNEYKCRQSVLIIAFWIANLVSWEVNHSQSTINKAVRHWVLQNKEYFGCIAQKNQSTAVLSCSSSTWWGKITWNWLERWRKHVRERERERTKERGIQPRLRACSNFLNSQWRPSSPVAPQTSDISHTRTYTDAQTPFFHLCRCLFYSLLFRFWLPCCTNTSGFRDI